MSDNKLIGFKSVRQSEEMFMPIYWIHFVMGRESTLLNQNNAYLQEQVVGLGSKYFPICPVFDCECSLFKDKKKIYNDQH